MEAHKIQKRSKKGLSVGGASNYQEYVFASEGATSCPGGYHILDAAECKVQGEAGGITVNGTTYTWPTDSNVSCNEATFGCYVTQYNTQVLFSNCDNNTPHQAITFTSLGPAGCTTRASCSPLTAPTNIAPLTDTGGTKWGICKLGSDPCRTILNRILNPGGCEDVAQANCNSSGQWGEDSAPYMRCAWEARGNDPAECHADAAWLPYDCTLVPNGADIGSTTTTTSAAYVASATGDPHLVNIHGHKFDIHDGPHRLVHYPRGAPESEALLMIDAEARMSQGQSSCYNVFFQRAHLSGKWVGDGIDFQHNSEMGQKSFYMNVGGQNHSWTELAEHAGSFKFTGSTPIKVSTQMRTPEKDMPGGDDIDLAIGLQSPVLVSVWSSHGSNELTDGENIQYLNLQVHNLPDNAGGILGVDSYTRPAGAQCGLTGKEAGPISSLEDLVEYEK